jgi:AraC-like DNA-binding protein
MKSELRAPIEFGTPCIALEIDRKTADQRLPTGNTELAHINELSLVEYLARLDRDAVGANVTALLVELLPAGPVSEDEMARRLFLSKRSLQRRLAEEETSFRQILDSTRHDLALRYLGNSHLTINEIGYLLGFSDPSNFTRAFRRWEGLSPSRYRSERSLAA